MTVKELKNQLEFFNDNLDVAMIVECACGAEMYVEPILVTDELQEGDEIQRFLVIEANLGE
jgi:hypothetical protein